MLYVKHSLFCSIPWWFPYSIFGILRFADVFYDDPEIELNWLGPVHALIFFFISFICLSLSHHQPGICRTITWFWLHFTIEHFPNGVNVHMLVIIWMATCGFKLSASQIQLHLLDLLGKATLFPYFRYGLRQSVVRRIELKVVEMRQR